ncbi:hypothetical protein PHLCEN_2v5590 [Hermanssonia centrifuga]|uniref:Uncharacterized protein n=1 Tax=Hermanssonia centrifuga TaxID=98765 RepID=A0A2R6P1Y4_9APHY|nr:hypothetical protein PHLCEN_2v5590 [Hermanssonia centrifuga]
MADCHARINGEKPAWIKLGLVLGHPPHDTNLERLNIWEESLRLRHPTLARKRARWCDN